jgi:hypothetical protein
VAVPTRNTGLPVGFSASLSWRLALSKWHRVCCNELRSHSTAGVPEDRIIDHVSNSLWRVGIHALAIDSWGEAKGSDPDKFWPRLVCVLQNANEIEFCLRLSNGKPALARRINEDKTEFGLT